MAHSGAEKTRTKGLRASIMKYSQDSSAWEREAGESKVSLGFLRPYLKKNDQVRLSPVFETMGTVLTGCTHIHVGKHTHKINQIGPASEGGLRFQKAAPRSP